MLRAIPLACLLALGLTAFASAQEPAPPPPPPVPPPPPAGAPQAPPGYGQSPGQPAAPPATATSQGYPGARPVLVVPGPVPGLVVNVEPDPPDEHRHDGLMVRLAIGGGYQQASSNEADVTTYGGSYSLHLNVGYALIDDLSIHGDILFFGMPNPKVRGDTSGPLGSDVNVTLGGIGFGATYYVAHNFFLTGSVSFMEIAFQDDDGVYLQSDLGGGFNVFVGKEFWVGNQWGLGGGIRGLVAWVPIPGELNTVLHLGAELSLTFQ